MGLGLRLGALVGLPHLTCVRVKVRVRVRVRFRVRVGVRVRVRARVRINQPRFCTAGCE